MEILKLIYSGKLNRLIPTLTILRMLRRLMEHAAAGLCLRRNLRRWDGEMYNTGAKTQPRNLEGKPPSPIRK